MSSFGAKKLDVRATAEVRSCSRIAHTTPICKDHRMEKAGPVRRRINYLGPVRTGSNDLNRFRFPLALPNLLVSRHRAGTQINRPRPSERGGVSRSTAAAALGISCGHRQRKFSVACVFLQIRRSVVFRACCLRHAISTTRLLRTAKYQGPDEHAHFDQGGTTPFVRA